MKAILVSAPSPYVNMLKRSLSLSNTEIISSYDSIAGFQANFSDPANNSFDVIIATDKLNDGTVVQLADLLKQMGLIDKTVFIIEDNSKDAINYYESNRYSYRLQMDLIPTEFIEDLEAGRIKIGQLTPAEEQKKQSDAIQSLERTTEYPKTNTYPTAQSQPVNNPIQSTNPQANTNPQVNVYQQVNTGQQSTGFQETQQTNRNMNSIYSGSSNALDYGRADLFGKEDIFNKPEPKPMDDGMETEDWTNQMTNRFGQPNLDPRDMQNAYQQQQKPTQTIQFKPIAVCVHSPKGGVGKTTLCMELASLLADRASSMDFNELGRLSYNNKIRVCLVDLNLSFDTMAATLESVYTQSHQNTITDWFHMINRKILGSVDNKTRMDLTNKNYVGIEKYLDRNKISFSREEVEQMVIVDKQTGLHIVPSISLPQDAGFAHPEYLKMILDTLKKYYDVVIIDTGNNISQFTEEAIKASDEVLIVCSKSKGSAATVQKLLKYLQNPRNPISTENFNLVINNPNGSENVYTSASFQKVLKLPLVAEIPYDENVRLAYEEGGFYSINNRKTEFAKACTKLAQSICPLWEVVPNRKTRERKKKNKKGSKKFLGLF